MRKSKALLFCGLTFGSAVLLAQTLPSTLLNLGKRQFIVLSNAAHQTVRRTSYLGGKEYVCTLEETNVSPDWESSAPLPVALAKIEEVTRTELRKFVADEPKWLVTDFQVSRFGRGPNWYYVIALKPDVEVAGVRPESFTFLMDFSGKPGLVLPAVRSEKRQ